MHRLSRPLALCLLFLAPALFAQSNTRHGFVHTQGPELVEPDGKPILLRGINLGNWLEAEGYMFHFESNPQSPSEIEALTAELIGPEQSTAFWHTWRDQYITEADIDQIKSMGFNSVRVPMHWKLFDSDNAEGFRLIDRLVTWARKDHIYLILDMHCAPGGQTGTNIDDSLGYPWLYRSPEAQQHAAAIWRRIAARYHNEPIILGYDLLNEPIPTIKELQQYNQDLEPVYRKLVAAVREVDKNHVVILGGAQWDTNFKVFSQPFDSNAMYTFHKYWMTPNVDSIREYLDFRDKYHVPVWLGESGENKDEWVAEFRKLLEDNNIGWCFWPYKKMDATSSPVTFDRPANWEAILAFAKLPTGTGNAQKRIEARPTPEAAQAAFDDLLKKIRFENTRVNQGYKAALLPAQP